MKIMSILLLLALLGLAGACKKEEVPLQPTLISLQVVYKQNGQPVDSAIVSIIGTKGTYLTGRQFATFAQGYTDQQGRFSASMQIPRDYFTTFTAGKLVKIGNRYKSYDLSFIIPGNTDILKHEQENSIIAQLDTLK